VDFAAAVGESQGTYGFTAAGLPRQSYADDALACGEDGAFLGIIASLALILAHHRGTALGRSANGPGTGR